ncbi:MAG TPA: XRE family transcriptional regulator [Oscillatoriaceae cyanobacterium M33_DOE_052]|uniref:XRE family transcriptional regulator n=1 Tax=Planktothricoides sp. SpSt-374 TaxID=2282167 RepID=A0A7C3VPG5_9CYAN|nr:XRE family transcriptional regulator [Oscillatoriaceae cyanobacterium M33_DOE_052]
MNREITIKSSSGNVFYDLGLDNPEELLVKAEIAFQLNNLITKNNLTETQVASVLGIELNQISELREGKLNGFSLEIMREFLKALGGDVEKETRFLALSQESI